MSEAAWREGMARLHKTASSLTIFLSPPVLIDPHVSGREPSYRVTWPCPNPDLSTFLRFLQKWPVTSGPWIMQEIAWICFPLVSKMFLSSVVSMACCNLSKILHFWANLLPNHKHRRAVRWNKKGAERNMPSCHAIPKCMHIFHDDAHCRHPCDLPPSPSLSVRPSGHGTSGGGGFWGFRLLHGSFAQGGQGVEGRRGRE